MSQFQDPSIISLVPATAPEGGETTNDNAITKFLREAEYKREEEESKKGTSTSKLEGSEEIAEEDESTKAARKEQELENWKLDLGPYNDPDRLRYNMDFLYSLKDSSDNIVPPELPPKSYYRLKNKPLQRANWTGNQYNNNNNNNNNGGRNNYNEGGQSTGAMGNFNLGKKTHDRGFNRYGNNGNNNNRRGHRHKKHDEDDNWIAELEKDEPAGGSAEDFEKWKAKMKLAERKRRGEVVEETEGTASAKSGEPKNSIDSFFSLAKPTLNKTQSSSSANTPDNSKNSKFFSFFKPESGPTKEERPTEASGNDGVSKILSLLDSGEKNAKAGSNASTPQVSNASPLQPSMQSQTPQQSLPQQQQQQQRSQFSFQNTGSPGGNPTLPPGLPQSTNQGQGVPGNKDSFFMSLMSKAPEQGRSDSNNNTAAQSPSVSSDVGTQRSVQPKAEQSTPKLPPGLQAPPGLSQQSSGQQQQQQQSQQGQQGLGQNQPMIPPLFQNGGNRNQGPTQGPPPGFNPQQLPPWLTQRFPPNMPNMAQGRFMPPPMPNGAGFPPQVRQDGSVPSNMPPPMFYARGDQGGQPNAPPVFYPQFGGPGTPNSDGQQRDQQRFPPPMYNGPPPGFYQNRDGNQQ